MLSDSSEALASDNRRQRFTQWVALGLVLAALFSSFYSVSWLVSDFTNLVSQIPELHQELEARHLSVEGASGDVIKTEEVEVISYGLKQQHFGAGVLGLLLSILLSLFAVHLLQKRPSQKKLYILGGIALLSLVALMGLASANSLGVALIPVIAGLFLTTELDVDLDDSDGAAEEEVGAAPVDTSAIKFDEKEDPSELSDKPLVVETKINEPIFTTPPVFSPKPSDEASGEKAIEPLHIKLSAEKPSAVEIVGNPKSMVQEKALRPEKAEATDYEMPELDELSVTGLMARPSVFIGGDYPESGDETAQENIVKVVSEKLADASLKEVPSEGGSVETEEALNTESTEEDSGDVDNVESLIAVKDELLFEGKEELSDLADLIGDDLLSETSMFYSPLRDAGGASDKTKK